MFKKQLFPAFLLLSLAGSANAQVLIQDVKPDGTLSLGGISASATKIYDNLAGTPNYSAFASGALPRAGVSSVDDYKTTIASPVVDLSELQFVGGVTFAAGAPAANRTLSFEFFDTGGVLFNAFTATFGSSGAFIWTISGLDGFLIPNAGFLRIGTQGATAGRWFLTAGTPLVGSTVANPPNLINSARNPLNYAFALSGTAAVPEPGAFALLAGVGVVGASFLKRRRK